MIEVPEENRDERASTNGWLPRCKKLYLRLGLDRAILYTLLGRVWTSLSGLVSIYFVTRCLSVDEQGYFYTFNSLVGLQVFFELGLAFVILQTASHERAHLEWAPGGTLTGDGTAKARLASLLRLVAQWYGAIATIFILLVVPVGLYFFATKGHSQAPIIWIVPWVWLVLASAGVLAISPFLAFCEGCGMVSEVALVRLFQGVFSMVFFWSVLAAKLKLFAIPVLSTASFLTGLLWLILYRRAFLLDLWLNQVATIKIDWWSEVWPFQWRIGLSWFAGYFIFQFFTPVLFAFHGPAAAGRMGMSITISGAVSTVALAWLTTKSPTFGRLAALRQISDLDRLFFRSLKQAIAVAGLLAITVLGLVIFIHYHGYNISRRLLDPLAFGLLVAATFVQVIVSAEAIYIRAFKEERFLYISIGSGVLIGASSYTFGRFFGATGMMAGYLGINLVVGLGMGTWVLARKRQQLKSEIVECA